MSTIELLANKEYKYGFVTDIESDMIPRGLSEDTVRLISEKKGEPEWMLEFRLKAYRQWLKMSEPKHWPNIKYPEVDYQDIIYYSAPKQKATKASLDEVDPELLRTFEKLGIPLDRAEAARERRRGRRLRLRLGRDDLQGEAQEARRHLLLVHRGGQGLPRTHQEVPRLGRARRRQLLRGA